MQYSSTRLEIFIPNQIKERFLSFVVSFAGGTDNYVRRR